MTTLVSPTTTAPHVLDVPTRGEVDRLMAQLQALVAAAQPLVPLVASKGIKSADQSLSSSSFTVLTFARSQFDTGGLHRVDAVTDRFTVPRGQSGLYLLVAAVSYASNATGQRYAQWFKNGTTEVAIANQQAVNGNVTDLQVTAVVSLTEGDYLQVRGFQNSGGALSVRAGSVAQPSTWASVTRLGDTPDVG